LPTSAEPLLFDTSAALAFVDVEHLCHEQVWDLAATRRRGLSGHAAFEFLSVLPRLPLPKRLAGADALKLVRAEFPDGRFLDQAQADALLDEFVALGIAGGMVYDGLVGACARAHGLPLLTCDLRAEDTYRALGVAYQLIREES